MNMDWIRWLLPMAMLAGGCVDDGGEAAQSSDGSSSGSSTGSTSAGSAGSSSGDADTDEGATSRDDAIAFMDRIVGLWVGPVDSNTSAGDFPTMNMDVRAADGHVLFARVDLDADNSLRFAFTFEDVDGEPALVFRNGGEFQGLLRDTRTRLVEADPEAGTWRFCALSAGCAYVDATFAFTAPDTMTMDVAVMGMMHFTWPATRAEARAVPSPFPIDDAVGSTTDPFPPMPSVRATLSWNDPLPEDTTAWLLLSTQPCDFMPANCPPSRFLMGSAPAGATEVEILLEQMHPGQYAMNAFLDRNANLGAILVPDAGDLVAVPDQAMVVEPSGETAVSVELSVELPGGG
jgi:hypothetical protein